MGLHDKAHVDAYFGPEELRTAAADTALTLDQIRTASQDLASRLAAVDTSGDAELAARIDATAGSPLKKHGVSHLIFWR